MQQDEAREGAELEFLVGLLPKSGIFSSLGSLELIPVNQQFPLGKSSPNPNPIGISNDPGVFCMLPSGIKPGWLLRGKIKFRMN